MNNDKEIYQKNLEDEIDWIDIDQLHESTMQISNQCFEYKKLCVGALGVIIAAMLKLGESTPILVISSICMFITIGFWMCDTTAYYYQRSNRQIIIKLQNNIITRNSNNGALKDSITKSWPSAIFNKSMLLYMYLSGIFLLTTIMAFIVFLIKICYYKI